MAANDIAALLRRTAPFSRLGAAELERAARGCVLRRFAPGDRLFSAREPADALWIVKSGLVRISTGDHALATIAFAGPGELIDNVGSEEREKHDDEAAAVVPTEAAAIPEPLYARLLARHHPMAVEASRLLAARLRECRRMRILLSSPGRRRLPALLLWLRARLGDEIPFTRGLLAEFAGLSREAAIRILSPMEKKGWISSRRGLIRIRKPQELELAAGHTVASL